MRPQTFAFINLFRALAAFWVLAAHCMIWGGWYGLPLPSAKLAVDLFMMISGFLMIATTQGMGNAENRLRFWMRRFFRIAPAYYLSLLLAALCAGPFLGGYESLQELNPSRWPQWGTYDPRTIQYDGLNIAAHVTFLFGLHPTLTFSTFLPDWSLSLEMQFYATFPFIAVAMQRFGYARTAIVLIGAGLFVSQFLPPFREPSLLAMKVQYFVAGLLLFHALRTKRWLLIGLALVATSLEWSRYGGETWVTPALLLAMLGMGVWEASGSTPRWLSSLVNSRAVQFASDTSYGVYLLHGFWIAMSGLIVISHPSLMALSPPARVAGMFAFVASGAYASAWLLHRWIELPGIQLGRLVLARRSERLANLNEIDVQQAGRRAKNLVDLHG